MFRLLTLELVLVITILTTLSLLVLLIIINMVNLSLDHILTTSSPVVDTSNHLTTGRSTPWLRYKRTPMNSQQLGTMELMVTMISMVTIHTLSTTTHISRTCLQS